MTSDFSPDDATLRGRNMHDLKDDTKLWRVFRLDYLLSLFTTRKNVLVKPAKWEDPFENFLGNCFGRIRGNGTIVSLRGIYGAFYGQCWTRSEPETDATWRIYAAGLQRAARVRVRAGPLFDTIYLPHDQYRSVRCFIGPVKYLSESELMTLVTSSGTALTFDGTGLGQARALMIKRTEFQHEDEVRLLYSTIDIASAADDLLRFDFDPIALVEDIVLDPRLTPAEFSQYASAIQAAGFSGPLSQSTLYRVPNFPVLDIDA